MKNTRRFISAVMALAMVSALSPMSAFAADGDPTTVDQNSTTKSGTMTATYDVTAKYTVTIPAGVTLDSTNAVPASIEASDVILESGKKITVKLTGASNTASGASFSAKTEKGDSTATYTIGKGEATTGVKVGDTVAEFTENGTQALTFSKAEGATHAGTHTETLTFNIAVEEAVKTLTLSGTYFDWNAEPPSVTKSLEIEYTDNDTWKDIAERYDEVSFEDNMYGPEGKVVKFWGDDGCELKSNESPYNYKLVSINDKVSAYSSYYLES